MINPLLHPFSLPPFSAIRPEHIVPAVEMALENCRSVVKQILEQEKNYTWETLCQPLAEAEDHLHRIFSPGSNLNAVQNTPELRQAYEQTLPLMSEYSTWLGQNRALYQAYCELKEGPDFETLSVAQKKAVNNAIRDFTLSGIDLPKLHQARYGEIVSRLSELSSTFSNHVLDSTMAWNKFTAHVDDLAGLPELALAAAKTRAEEKGMQGWLLTLDVPCYLSVMTYCDDPALREEMYRAYATRASDQGPHAGQWDNTCVMEEILSLRHELARLLGFSSYAEKSLTTKMANDPKQVLDFLTHLAQRVRPQAEKELAHLKEFAKKHYQQDNLEPWDISYYSEKQKQFLYDINEEQLRPYFPETRVLSGLFDIVKRLYNVEIKERHGVDVWAPEVRYFDILNKKGELCGSFYLDLYAREHKRAGAWMDSYIGRMRHCNGHIQKPVAYLICNFLPPAAGKTACFTHEEVTTLFHEFGHGLHHILTSIDTPGVAGIDGVAWDAVEIPSQLMEKWCWEPEVLSLISGHVETNEPLPIDWLNHLIAAKNYQSALFILRQLEFALFDFRLHSQYDPTQETCILETLNEVKKEISVIKTPGWSRFPHSFSHIFAGGYAAGYYSYLWADVLAADAYSRFKEEGIFNAATGKAFLDDFLALGGSEDPMVLFRRFRGRDPKSDALLKQYGIQD